MKRRSFLEALAAIPLFSSVWRYPAISMRAALADSTIERVRPSDSSWPTAASWEKLKQQVGGQLIPVSSPLAPCKDAPGSAGCTARIEEMKNPYFIGEQAGGTQTSGWLEGWTSAPSAYAVVVRNTDDVVAAVNFARDNYLRLVVKGGGHSYQGTSNAADSLLIWTREMNQVTLHDSFVAEGCGGTLPRLAVTIEAGARWLPTYNEVTTKAGRYVQGGGCATVGVAGLIQSGGFGSFSKNYGLAAASLLQAEIITADGKVLIANASMNPDLFWALKGGGGGSFGVVTKVTLATYELPAFFGRVEGLIKANSDDAFRNLIGAFMRSTTRSCLIAIGASRSPSRSITHCRLAWRSRDWTSLRLRRPGYRSWTFLPRRRGTSYWWKHRRSMLFLPGITGIQNIERGSCPNRWWSTTGPARRRTTSLGPATRMRLIFSFMGTNPYGCPPLCYSSKTASPIRYLRARAILRSNCILIKGLPVRLKTRSLRLATPP